MTIASSSVSSVGDRHSQPDTDALWFRKSKNPDKSSGQIVRPFICLHHFSFACFTLLASLAHMLCSALLACSPTHSWKKKSEKESKLNEGNFFFIVVICILALFTPCDQTHRKRTMYLSSNTVFSLI